jgi:hypothetical protein
MLRMDQVHVLRRKVSRWRTSVCTCAFIVRSITKQVRPGVRRQRCTIDETAGLKPKVDWMEWRANYAGAALLMMPLRRLVLTVGVCLGKGGIAPVATDAPKANDLAQRVSEAAEV